MSRSGRWRAPRLLLGVVVALASSAGARILKVDGPNGPVYVNVPEPAADVVVHPSEKGVPFRPVIERHARTHGVDAALVEAIVACESNFDPAAVSRAGAMGLMQLMPATARELGIDDAHDPDANIDGGARYLAELLRTFDGNRRLAIAAYNAGAGAVKRAAGLPPFPETLRYVEKVERYLAELGGVAASPSQAPWTGPKPSPSGPPQSLHLVRDAAGRLVITNAGGSAARSREP